MNLIEFAFGLDPTQNSAGQLPQGQQIGGNFVMSFTRPAGVSGITYGAEWSTTLSDNPLDRTAIADSDPGTTGYTFSVPIGSNTNLFMRLKVTSSWQDVEEIRRAFLFCPTGVRTSVRGPEALRGLKSTLQWKGHPAQFSSWNGLRAGSERTAEMTKANPRPLFCAAMPQQSLENTSGVHLPVNQSRRGILSCLEF